MRALLLRLTVPALLLGLLGASPDLEAQTKPRVAILGFENNSTSRWGDRLGAAASDEMATQLVNTGAFSVVERQQLEAILAEQRIGVSGAIDPATAARIGEVLGVQALIMGSITKFSIDTKSGGVGPFSASFSEAESAIDVRVVNTSTAEILMVAEGEGTKRFGGAAYEDRNFERSFDAGMAQEALRPAIGNAVALLIGNSDVLAAMKPAEQPGAVVGASGPNYYIDRGENFGVQVGDRFDVFRVVDEIRDGDGNVLDRVTDRVGVLEVSRVLSQSAIASVVEGEVREGDEVRPAG